MKKYTLYDEFMRADIYGADFAEAVYRQKEFRRPTEVIGGERVPQPPVIVKRTIGYEDTSDTTRGNERFIRVIVETVDGKIRSIDGRETKCIKEFPDCRKIETEEVAA